MHDPVVSICCLTFNHESYIAEALDSFLMQVAEFDFEILVHDDASTDGTPGILRDYEARYPGVIRCIYQNDNQYSKGARVFHQFLWPHAKGKYIALCEGDDYWLSPHKLQKQVKFLDCNPTFAITCHAVSVVNGCNIDFVGEIAAWSEDKIFNLENIVYENFIATCSCVFRNNITNDFPEWYYRLKMGDWSLHILNAQHGHIQYFHEFMAVYRVHSGGIWSGASIAARSEEVVNLYKAVNRFFNYTYNDGISRRLKGIYEHAFIDAVNNGDARQATKVLAFRVFPLFLTGKINLYALLWMVSKAMRMHLSPFAGCL